MVANDHKKHKETPSTEKPKPPETTTRRSLLSRKRVGYSPAYTGNTKALNQSEQTTTHSRLFFRRNRTNTTTVSEDTNPPETTAGYRQRETTKQARAVEEDGTHKHRYNKFRSRFATPASTESKVDIRNFFQQKRQSTSTEPYSEVPPTTVNPFSKQNSRYFSRNRKTTTTVTEGGSSKEYPVTTTRGRFLKDKFYRKTTSKGELLDSVENKRYSQGSTSSTERLLTDQIPLSDSNEQPEVVGRNNTVRSVEEVNTTEATTDVPTATESTNTESRIGETTIYPSASTQLSANAVSKPTTPPETSSQSYWRISPRNNSRFLKNPEQEYLSQKRKENFVRGPSRYTHTTSSPVSVESQRELAEPRHANDIDDGQRTTMSKSTSAQGRSLNFEVGGTRGRHKYSDKSGDEGSTTGADGNPQTARKFDFRRRSRIHYSSLQDEVVPGETTTRRAVITNRGSIKAKNSLSRAEIKELANLVETSSGKTHTRKHHHQTPINRIEENSNLGYDGRRKVVPFYREPNNRFYTTVGNQFGVDKIDPVFDFDDRIYEERTEAYYPGGANGLTIAPPEADSVLNDVFRVSETQYGNDDVRRTKSTQEGETVDTRQNVVQQPTSTKEAEV